MYYYNYYYYLVQTEWLEQSNLRNGLVIFIIANHSRISVGRYFFIRWWGGTCIVTVKSHKERSLVYNITIQIPF